MEQKRKLHLDVLRILAAFFVIFNHTPAFSYFTHQDPTKPLYWLCLSVSVLCKISVPMFFMMSGALLLGREEKPLRILQRALRILAVLVIFSFLSYLQQVEQGNQTFDLKHFFEVVMKKDWLNAYWYLYAYLAFILCLPFLRAIVKGLKPGHYRYLMGLQLFFQGILPVVLNLILKQEISFNRNFSFGWLLGYVPLYPLIGYYLENVLDIRSVNWKKMAGLWLSFLVCLGLTCYATYLNNADKGGFPQTYLMSFIMMLCIPMYITAKKLFMNFPASWIGTLLTSVGSCTFGIYLIHGLLLRDNRLRLLSILYRSGDLPSILKYSVACLDIMFTGYCITWFLKKIPGIKKLL